MNAEQEKDFSLLRPFDLKEVSEGSELCDTRGRAVSLDASTEMIAQLGPGSLRMLPECWIDGKPVYWDSVLLLSDGTERPFDAIPDGKAIFGWPDPKPDQVVEVYVDGKLAGTNTIPHNAVLMYWELHTRIEEKG